MGDIWDLRTLYEIYVNHLISLPLVFFWHLLFFLLQNNLLKLENKKKKQKCLFIFSCTEAFWLNIPYIKLVWRNICATPLTRLTLKIILQSLTFFKQKHKYCYPRRH